MWQELALRDSLTEDVQRGGSWLFRARPGSGRGHLKATPSTRRLGVQALWAPGWCGDRPWHPLLPRERGSQPVRALWSSEFPTCRDCKEGLELLCPHLPHVSPCPPLHSDFLLGKTI